MKWTLIPLLGSALIVYVLIFLTQSSQEPDPTTPESATASAAQSPEPARDAAKLAVGPEGATAAPLAKNSNASPSRATSDQESALAEASEDEEDAWPTGCDLYEQGDYAAARGALEGAVRAQENRAGRHYLLGLCYLKLQETDLAVSELERAVELKPEAARYQVNLARAYLAAEEPQTAREVVDSALDLQLEYADAWEVLGRVELEQGNRPEAEAAFTKAVQFDPEHAWAWNNLAYLRILESRFEEAEQPLRTAISLRPDVASFQNNLGVVEEHLGHLAEAVASYEQALELGHDTAGTSAERVRAVVAYQELQAEQQGSETRVATTSADSLIGGW